MRDRYNVESLLKELREDNFKLNIETYNIYRRTGVITSSKAIKGTQAHELTLSDESSTVATII